MKSPLLLAALPLIGACITYPPPAPAPYRAVGQVQNWTLVIDQQNVTWLVPGQPVLAQPAPQPIVGVAGEIYRTPRIDVNIVHQPCRESRSNRIYPDTVQVNVDGIAYTGCGGL